MARSSSRPRVIVLGLDGFEPSLVEPMFERGELPNLATLRARGGYARLATTHPPQTPVAWSTFAVGAGPGTHGIFDFLTPDPRTGGPEVALFGFEQPNRFLPPRAVNRRGGTPVWEHLGAAGIPSTILRHPCTFPPARFSGRLLAGVGVPDLRGAFGTGTVWQRASVPDAGTPGALVVDPDRDGGFRGGLPGPQGAGGAEASVPVRLMPIDADRVRLEIGTGVCEVVRGGWSRWLDVTFRLGALQKLHGRVRFFVPEAGSATLLYASPVNYDPKAPPFPISHPWDFAGELDRAVGPFATLGMAEDHDALDHGTIDEATFISQCTDVMRERRAMIAHELARFEHGLFFALFDTPDRVAHMLWRGLEPDHPANAVHGPAAHLGDALREHYRACDAAIGEALALTRPDDLVIVLSDHGFAGYRRNVDVNRWLADEGYLVLRSDADASTSLGIEAIDWSRSRAWGIGMAGIYLNVDGRGPTGIVRPADAHALATEIAARLTGLRDDRGGGTAITRAWTGRELHSGPHADAAPDVVIGCARGWRVSSASATGGIAPTTFSPNTRRWSGDHVMDPSQVPGILVANRPLLASDPHLIDLAPTIQAALGIEPNGAMEGRVLIQ